MHESFDTEEMRKNAQKMKRHEELYSNNKVSNKKIDSKLFNNRKPRSTPVKCLETEKIFASISEAAMAIDCDPNHLSKSIKAGKPVKGFKFIYVG